MRTFTLALGLLALTAITSCYADLMPYTVASKDDLVKAVADATSKATATTPVDVLITLNAHVDLGNTTLTLEKIHSIAIVGACTAALPTGITATSAKTGACAITVASPGQVLMKGSEENPMWRQVYMQNIVLTDTTTSGSKVSYQMDYATMWYVDTDISKFSMLKVYKASLYIIDSSVTDVADGISMVFGGLNTTESPSESTFIVSRSKVTGSKAPALVLLDSTNATVVFHSATIQGTANTFIDGAPGKVNVFNDTDVEIYTNMTYTTIAPFVATAPPAWGYNPANQAYLQSLLAAGVTGANRAMHPFSDIVDTVTALPPGTVAPPPGTPVTPTTAAPPGTPVTGTPPATDRNITANSATSLTKAVAIAVALLAAGMQL